MNILDSYINDPFLPKKPSNYTISRSNENSLCDDTIEVYLTIENNILVDFNYQGNLSLVSLWSVSFLHDVLLGMPIEEIENLKFSFFASKGVYVTMRRQKTLALPLVAIINAIKAYRWKDDFVDIEVFAYT